MATLNSALEIEVLLHCYYSPTEHPRMSCTAVSEAHDKLLQLKAIDWTGEPDNRYLGTTALGRAWVKALLLVPAPRIAYVAQNGTVLEVQP